MPKGDRGLHSVRSSVSVAGYSKGAASVTERGIRKSLPPERFVDLREGEAKPGDPTGDLAYNAEMRWEAMTGEGYLTPVESFFVRNHAPTPSKDPGFWPLRVEGPGVERPLRLTYDDLSSIQQVSIVEALECAGNGRGFFEELQARRAEGTPWGLGPSAWRSGQGSCCGRYWSGPASRLRPVG